MCLIAHRAKPGSHIPNSVIDYNKTINPDGFGLMWRDKDEVVARKYGPDEFEFFRNQLKALDVTDVEYAAHWRNATAGTVDKDMAHPYLYEDLDGTPIALMHNGIIDIKTPKGWSDTLTFTEAVLANMATGWWHDPALRFLVESAIGWSRILLFTPDETVTINEPDWLTDNAIRFSTKPMGFKNTVVSRYNGWLGDDDDIGFTYRVPSKSSVITVPAKDDEAEDEDEEQLFKDEEQLSIKDEWGVDISVVGKAEDVLMRGNWVHSGHLVQAVNDITSIDKDISGDCMCMDCEQQGEFYIIDGSVYIDMDHAVVVDNAGLPFEMPSDGRAVGGELLA